MTMAIGEAAGGLEASGAGAGAGKVIDAHVVKSTPLRATGTRTAKAKDAATTGAAAGAGSAGTSRMFDGGLAGKAAKGVADTVAPTSSARKWLLAEFCLCMVVLAFSPLTGTQPTPGAFMKRGSAIMGLFFVLGLLATAGQGAARAASGFGGLISLVLLISDRSIFVTLAKKFGKGVGEEEQSDGLDADDSSADDTATTADAVPGVSKLEPASNEEIANQLQDILGRTYGVR
jgi:uncharacterized membrane protein